MHSSSLTRDYLHDYFMELVIINRLIDPNPDNYGGICKRQTHLLKQENPEETKFTISTLIAGYRFKGGQ